MALKVGDKVRQTEFAPHYKSDDVANKVGTIVEIDESPYPILVRIVGSHPLKEESDPDFELWPFKENELVLVEEEQA